LRWAQKRHSDYPILYLAFHGVPGAVDIGDRRRNDTLVRLDDLSELLEGRCRGRFIHFASCDTLRVDKRHLNRFMRDTGALAVSGYRGDVDWLASAAFEVFLAGALQENSLSLNGIRAAKRRIHRDLKCLEKAMGFRLETRA
jgi:hypothetical protein